MRIRNSLDWLLRMTVVFGSVILAAMLILFAYIGTNSRFWADDYCYSAMISIYGWWQGIVTWYLTSGNRFSTIFTVGLIDFFGPGSIQVLPGLLLGFWILAWFFFLDQIRRAGGLNIRQIWLVFIALSQVYFIALLSPTRLQVIYWRMGMLHYSFPMPWLLAHMALTILFLRKRDRLSFWPIVLSGVSSFYIGGQSEPTAFMQAAIFGSGILASLFFLKQPLKNRAAWLMAASFIGTLVAILVLFVSPYNANRWLYMPKPDSVWLIFPYSFRYVIEFIFYSIRGQVIPYAVFFISNLAAFVFVLATGRSNTSVRSLIAGIGITVVFIMILLVATFLPSAYANLQYPGPRALMPSTFLLLTGLAVVGFFLAAIVLKLFRNGLPVLIHGTMLFLFIATCLYPIRPMKVLWEERNTLVTWAARWDTRDEEIRTDIAAGETDLQTRQIEVIRTLEDIGPNPNYWLNICTAGYYGVQSITASP